MMASRLMTKVNSQMAKGSAARMSMVVPKRGHRLRKSLFTTLQKRVQSKVLFMILPYFGR